MAVLRQTLLGSRLPVRAYPLPARQLRCSARTHLGEWHHTHSTGPGFRTDADDSDVNTSLANPAPQSPPPQQQRSNHLAARLPALLQLHTGRGWQRKALEELWGRVAYLYFCWRKDTASDLQLLVILCGAMFLAGALLEGSIMQQLDGTPSGLWAEIYTVINWVLSQDLPGSDARWQAEAFAVMVATTGIAAFALVLALVEQVVLEVLESNVERGSVVYERGHVVVLAWCQSASDLSQLARVLGQACHANSGGVVVVLSQDRDKLEMERIFSNAIPISERRGTKMVFRRGSPLDPAALRMVAAQAARAVIIFGDGGATALNSDAQCLRAAVLLDELVGEELAAGCSSTPAIIVEMQAPGSLCSLQFSCSSRVFGVPALQIQAHRIARICRNPAATVVTSLLPDYRSRAHLAVHACPPAFVGLPFKDLHFLYPHAILLGVWRPECGGASLLNPLPSRPMGPGEHIIMLRPGPVAASCMAATPLEVAPKVDIGHGWQPSMYSLHSQDDNEGVVLGSSGRGGYTAAGFSSSQAGHQHDAAYDGSCEADWQAQDKALELELPPEYSCSLVPHHTSNLLICGWGEDSFMASLLAELDRGALPPGSRVTLLSERADTGMLDALGIKNIKVRHVRADPRDLDQLRRSIDLSKVGTALVLADVSWTPQSSGADEAESGVTQMAMLRMDASVLLVQLNIRVLLQDLCLRNINVVVQRMSMIGNSRFENAQQPPFGLPVCLSSYSGKILTQAAYDPRFLEVYMKLEKFYDLSVQDAASFAGEGEELSFMQLQARALAVHQILVGWFRIPSSVDLPLEFEVNPQGLAARSETKVWNRGDGLLKLVTLLRRQNTVPVTLESSMDTDES